VAEHDEEKLLHSVALQNAQSILAARRQAERDLIQAKEALARKAEEIAEEREWFRTVLSSIGDAVITTGIDGTVTFLNADAERLTGWNSSEALGHPLQDVFIIVDRKTRKTTANRITEVLRGSGSPAPHRHSVLIARNGVQTEIEDSVARVKDSAGIVTGAVVVFRNIAERLHAEQALQQSESRKAAVLDAALDAIITMDHEGKIIDFSASSERMFGYRRESAIGQLVASLLIPAHLRQRHQEGLARYLVTGETTLLGKRIEMQALRADGSEFPAELSISRIAQVDPPVFTATLRDIENLRVIQNPHPGRRRQ